MISKIKLKYRKIIIRKIIKKIEYRKIQANKKIYKNI